MIYKGNDKIVSIMLGNTPCIKVFKSNELVYELEPSIINTIIGTTNSNKPFNIKINNKSYTITPVNNEFTFEYKEEVTDIYNMFQDCASITSLDLSNFDISKVTNMCQVFYGCSKLKSINLSGWDIPTDFNWKMFKGCYLNNIICNQAFKDYCLDNKAQIILPNAMEEGGTGIWQITNDFVPTLLEIEVPPRILAGTTHVALKVTAVGTEYNQYTKENGNNEITKEFVVESTDFGTNTDTVNERVIPITYTYKGLTATTSLIQNKHITIGSNCIIGTTLDDEPFDIYVNDNEITITPVNNTFEYEFEEQPNSLYVNCENLVSIDVSALDISNFEYIDSIFDSCTNLTSILGLENWDTSHATGMSYIFAYCESLTSIDLSGWNTSNVEEADDIFYGCQNLTSVNLSGWDFSSFDKSYHWYIFNGCESLTSINLSGCDFLNMFDKVFEHSKYDNSLTNVRYLNISGCKNLVPNISDIDNRSIIIAEYLPNLTHIDVTNCDTSYYFSVGPIPFLFKNLKKLTTIEGLNTLNSSNTIIHDYSELFSNCISLTSIDIHSWNIQTTSNIQRWNLSRMFFGCKSLTSLDVSGIDIIDNNVNMANTFIGFIDLNNNETIYIECENLTHIKCKQSFKDYCIAHENSVGLHSINRIDWEIVS